MITILIYYLIGGLICFILLPFLCNLLDWVDGEEYEKESIKIVFPIAILVWPIWILFVIGYSIFHILKIGLFIPKFLERFLDIYSDLPNKVFRKKNND